MVQEAPVVDREDCDRVSQSSSNGGLCLTKNVPDSTVRTVQYSVVQYSTVHMGKKGGHDS